MGGSPDESQVAFSLTTSQWPTRRHKARALLSRPDRCRILAAYGFVPYAMAHLEAWHLALPKCQATTTRRRAASRWNFYRQIDKPRRMGGRPSDREHADRLRDNTLCRRKPLVCVLQLLIEIIEVAWQYPPHFSTFHSAFSDNFVIFTSCPA
jgi:hypothetical protein